MAFSLKRCLAALLGTAFLFTAVPYTASADSYGDYETEMPETILFPSDSVEIEQLPGYIVTVANPLYDNTGAVLEEFKIPPIVNADMADFLDTQYYINMEDAANIVREKLHGWETSIMVPFRISTNEEISNEALEDFLTPYVEEIFSLAQEHTGNSREGDYIAWNFYKYGYGYTECYRVTYPSDGHTEFYMYLTYSPYYRTTAAQEAEFDVAVDELLTEMFGEDRSTVSTYKTIKTIYDWVCANVTYDHTHLGMGDDPYDDTAYRLHHTAYAALINHTSVCQGYALLMYHLLLEMNIDCRFIAGQGNGGAHGWNIVEIDDLYYNLDATWDAGSSNYSYFLLNEKNFTENYTDHIRDNQFDTVAFHEQYPMSTDDYVYVGDVDGNGSINKNDALYLLRYTLLPNRYPLAVSDADFNCDNIVNAKDAAYLLETIAG